MAKKSKLPKEPKRLKKAVSMTVGICRISYAFRDIEVMARDSEEAIELAMEEAGSLEFSEKSAEYKLGNGVTLTKLLK